MRFVDEGGVLLHSLFLLLADRRALIHIAAMEKAPIFNDEFKRLTELLELEMLDTPPDPVFDEITAIAKELCQTPISLVALIDSTREWFKSKQGTDLSEFPRDMSFCGHAIASKDIFIVPNAGEDPRFADNPLVTGPTKLIFYAGVPLRTANGYGIGTLCVADHVPRQLTPMQIQGLKVLAKNVTRLFELKSQNREIKRLAQNIAEKEQQIIETARLASLGEMAGGMAHEINNPLSIILARAESARRDLAVPIDPRAKLESIIQNCERIAKIISDLLTFSRDKTVTTSVPLDALEVITKLLSMSKERFAKHGIEVRVKCETSCSFIGIERPIIECLRNLLSNSFEALRELEEKWIEIDVHTQNKSVRIQVTDSGCGIKDPKVLEKMMLPFFTTKELGKGTGLGLSTTKSQIEQQGGHFYYDRKSNHTRFVIELPANREGQIAKRLHALH